MRNFYRFHRVLPVAVLPVAGISAISKWKDQIQAKERRLKVFSLRIAWKEFLSHCRFPDLPIEFCEKNGLNICSFTS